MLGAAGGLVGGLSSFGLNTFIAIFVLFFLLREDRSMLRRAAVVLPLRPDQVRRLFALVKETLRAIVYGTLAMAAIRGTLTGLAFWFLGLTSPVVWGLLASLLAVLPVVGTTLVWLPATSMLLLSGHWIKGVILLIWGIAVVHPVDNVLRPYLIGERVKLSTLYVFFALVGGQNFWRSRCVCRTSNSSRDRRSVQIPQRGKTRRQLGLSGELRRRCEPNRLPKRIGWVLTYQWQRI